MQQTAGKLIAGKGRSVVVRRDVLTRIDPLTEGVLPGIRTDTTVQVVLLPVKESASGLVRDQQGYRVVMDALTLPFPLAPTDLMIVDGIQYGLSEVTVLAPDGTPVIYTAIATRR
jgi:hypothetical protein